MVVHLDFGDVGPQAGHVMDDRIGQAAIVGSDGGDDDLHGKSEKSGGRGNQTINYRSGCVEREAGQPRGCTGMARGGGWAMLGHDDWPDRWLVTFRRPASASRKFCTVLSRRVG